MEGAARRAEERRWQKEELWQGEQVAELWTATAGLRVCSWNVNRALAAGAEQGLRSLQQKVEAVLDWMASAGVSVLGLQETGWGGVEGEVKGAVRQWARARGRQVGVWMAARKGSKRANGGARAGVAVVVLGEWAAKVQTVRRWASGRMVSVEMQMGNNQVVWLASAYAPSGQGVAHARRKRRFLEQCSEEMREAGERGVARTLVLADGNFWESEADHGSRAGGWLPGVEWREEMGLADAWRVRHAELPGFTRGRQGQPETRIDYVWIEGEWEAAVEEAWV